VANLKMKNLGIISTNTNNIAFVSKKLIPSLGICVLIAIHFENRTFVNLFCNQFLVWDVVYVQTPNLLNIGKTILILKTTKAYKLTSL